MQEFKDGGGGNEEALFFYSCNWLFCEMVVFLGGLGGVEVRALFVRGFVLFTKL